MTPPMHRDPLRNFSGGQNPRTILLRYKPQVTDSPPVFVVPPWVFSYPIFLLLLPPYIPCPFFDLPKTWGLYLGRIVTELFRSR